MMNKKFFLSVVALILVLSYGNDVFGGRFRYRNRQYYQTTQNYQYNQSTYTVQTTQTVETTQTIKENTPRENNFRLDFLAWINKIRANHGLHAVRYSESLENAAVSNNTHQSQRGLGHFFQFGRRQNAGWGSYQTVLNMWVHSPAHYSALVDPYITEVGIAGDGQYWTFEGN